MLLLFIQSDDDRKQSCEDIADSSTIYTTPLANVTGGGGAVGVGVGGQVGRRGGGEGGVGGRDGVGGDPSKRRHSDGGFVTRKKTKN